MDDVGRHFDIYGDPEVSAYAPSGPLADKDASRRMLQAMKDHWWKHGFGNWAISTAENPGHVIGFGGLAYRQINGKERLIFRFRFAWDTWGMGYGHDLGRACFGVAFGELRADAVHALVRPDNALAIQILEQLSMRQTETLDDVPEAPPSLVYAITADEARAAGF